MNQTTLYFMRHGQVYNPQDILYGRLPNFGLSEKGIKDVENAATKLKNFGITHIYSSPMLRAKQTAKIIGSKLGIEASTSRLLNEVRIIFQGMPLSKYRLEIQPKLYNQQLVAKGQESIDEIASRMMKFLHTMIQRHSKESILAISHGDPILILAAKTKGIPFTWEYKRSHYLQPGKFIKVDVIGDKYRWSM
ncbi:histidine phosphatase family protein [Candidatus Gottesmanbacteria bacterium]|nr:histidine phosphatase family protein [Candidatus Gottesmanbacteria bacterium]